MLTVVATDLTGNQVAELLGRAISVPVSEGTARFAQDNKGEVRSLLAARWLHDRLEENCPKSAIRNLLFATLYGEEVAIPSMKQPAAWLSIWDPENGRELSKRESSILVPSAIPHVCRLRSRSLRYEPSLGSWCRAIATDWVMRIRSAA